VKTSIISIEADLVYKGNGHFRAASSRTI
ncbi:hypothetical protein CCACVL1_12533, partial [Corchorus capsularis]